MLDKSQVKAWLEHPKQRAKRSLSAFFRWGFFALLCGALAGVAGTLLFWVLHMAQSVREAHGWLVYLLPVAGVIIVFLYRTAHMASDRGTNRIVCAVRGEEEVPLRTAALIFFGTALTHLYGGSSGREGAALQLGGSIGSWLSRVFKVDRQVAPILVMCGMSAAFAAIFGTPVTAAVFALELATVGAMPFVAFWPCGLSALIGYAIRLATGADTEFFHIAEIPEFGLVPLLQVALVAIGCALVSQLFCHSMTFSGKLIKRVSFLENPYVRVVVGAVGMVLITLIFGHDYNGTGMGVIEQAITRGEADWYAFLIKLVATVLTLKFGFKGGEIVPAMFMGATFGCVFGGLIGLSPSLSAAIGLTALFAGVTNCPIAAVLLSFELFGAESAVYALLAVPISWSLSGYASLYSKQHFLFSKYQLSAWEH